ncbi:MAG: hypothetical protein WCI27_10020 [Candidatus Omnitrophota bacterium]
MTTNTHGPAIEFNLDPAMLARLQNASGVSPVIIGVNPLKSLSEFLGGVKPQVKSHILTG